LLTVVTSSERDTEKLGSLLGNLLFAGAIVSLEGSLGAGKTTLARGVGAGLRVDQGVKSPTFNILNIYNNGRLPLYHFDFYRLSSEEELDQIGWEEFLGGDGVSLVEWGDKFSSLFPRPYLRVQLSLINSEKRKICFDVIGAGKRYNHMLKELRKRVAWN